MLLTGLQSSESRDIIVAYTPTPWTHPLIIRTHVSTNLTHAVSLLLLIDCKKPDFRLTAVTVLTVVIKYYIGDPGQQR